MFDKAKKAAADALAAAANLILPTSAIEQMLKGMASIALEAHKNEALTNVRVGAEFHMGPVVFSVSADVDCERTSK